MSPNDLKKLQISGLYKDMEMMDPEGGYDNTDVDSKIDELQGLSRTANDEEYTLLEMHVNLDLDGFEDKDENGEPTG